MEMKFNENDMKLWKLFLENCIRKELFDFMYLEESLKKLNDFNLDFNTLNNIVKKFVQNHKKLLQLLQIQVREKYSVIHMFFQQGFLKLFKKIINSMSIINIIIIITINYYLLLFTTLILFMI